MIFWVANCAYNFLCQNNNREAQKFATGSNIFHLRKIQPIYAFSLNFIDFFTELQDTCQSAGKKSKVGGLAMQAKWQPCSDNF